MVLVGAPRGGFLLCVVDAGWLAAGTMFIATDCKQCSCDSFVHASLHVVLPVLKLDHVCTQSLAGLFVWVCV
jgi:hypothetical protein